MDSGALQIDDAGALAASAPCRESPPRILARKDVGVSASQALTAKCPPAKASQELFDLPAFEKGFWAERLHAKTKIPLTNIFNRVPSPLIQFK
jgi:hypothetical protein